MSRRRHIIDKQGRNFIVKLHEYFERECQNGGPLLPVQQVSARVGAALGVGHSTVSRILKEKYGASGMEDNELKTPRKTRKRAKKCEKKSEQSNNDNSNRDSVVPDISISTDTVANNERDKNLPITKDNEQHPKKRKRKLNDSDTFNVDELLNYELQNNEHASVKQNIVVDQEISRTSASNGQVEKDAVLDLEQSELINYKIHKGKTRPAIENPLDIVIKSLNIGQSSSAHKINVLPALGDDRKSIAKADFKIGRINLTSDENVIEKYPKIGTRSDLNTSIDKFEIELIKEHVKVYHTRNETPTVGTLLTSLRHSGLFSGSKKTLLQMLEKAGFLFKKPRIT